MVHTDFRVKLTSEILNGVRIIKYYAWENAFIANILETRQKELKLLQRMGYLLNTVFALLLQGAPHFQTVLIFAVYISLNNQQITASKAFTAVTLFGLMTSPFIFLVSYVCASVIDILYGPS